MAYCAPILDFQEPCQWKGKIGDSAEGFFGWAGGLNILFTFQIEYYPIHHIMSGPLLANCLILSTPYVVCRPALKPTYNSVDLFKAILHASGLRSCLEPNLPRSWSFISWHEPEMQIWPDYSDSFPSSSAFWHRYAPLNATSFWTSQSTQG